MGGAWGECGDGRGGSWRWEAAVDGELIGVCARCWGGASGSWYSGSSAIGTVEMLCVCVYVCVCV